MKKIISCLLAVLFIAAVFSACGNLNSPTDSPNGAANNERLSIVATTFPQYDWICQILGDKVDTVELTLLLDDGVELHSYQPSVEDIAKISTCDMFIYVGGESDDWVHDALETATNKDMLVINMMEVLGNKVKEEEVVEGMEHSHDHEHSHDADHAEEDEHVWLSLKNAQMLCNYITRELENLDAANSSVYASNGEAYNEKLAELDLAYQNAVDGGAVDTLLFGDRFPFRYLVDDYGISYYAAFSGCSAETEASFETIVFLANKMDELALRHVMVIESADQSIARTVIENTGAKNQTILVLDSMQSVTAQEISSGTTYLSIMESNLDVLKEALS